LLNPTGVESILLTSYFLIATFINLIDFLVKKCFPCLNCVSYGTKVLIARSDSASLYQQSQA